MAANKDDRETAENEAYDDDEDMILDPDAEPPAKGCKGHRERMRRFLTYSRRFQIAIVVLVVLDCLIVIIELLMDLGILIRNVCESNDECPDKLRNATCYLAPEDEGRTVCGYSSGENTCLEEGKESISPAEGMHVCGLIVLSLFLVEIILKLYCMDISFFKHKLEVFDAIVVIVSFALDVAYSGNEDAWDGVGLLILLRLWRVTRIINGIIISVKKKSEKQAHEMSIEMDKLKAKIAEMQDELDQMKFGDVPKSSLSEGIEKKPLGSETLAEDTIVLEPRKVIE
ncbi:voltage-gated hydrogen channel 1-like [Oscarella lobularis]|uniref:voltage-gated hydrogen channel 1-like n=1 Tax=Oscarella lobularis TaxID=121494 RepID=UPI0033141F1B